MLWKDASIQHFKERINEILSIYTKLYLPLSTKVNRDNSETISDDIYNMYLKTGNFYHRSYRIKAPGPVSAVRGPICFCRGYPVETEQFVSGAGTYLPYEPKKQKEFKLISPQVMFQLSDCPLKTYGQRLLDNQEWKFGYISVAGVEYLSRPEIWIPQWMKDYFAKLTDAGIGVYQSPFIHQIQALENAVLGKDLFVATGTGSGKTECFMWPILAKLANEARNQKQSWEQRGTRIIIMYPMNALVSDQVGRLRRLIGDTEDKFVQIYSV